MKKIILGFFMLLCTTMSYAQFEQNTYYVNASLSKMNLSYSGSERLNFAVDLIGGKFLTDNVAVLGTFGYDSWYGGDDKSITLVAGGRYYIQQNGVFLGLGIKFVHTNIDYNDVMPTAEVGYAFFMSKTFTLEPSVYYNQSFQNHKDYSKIGFRIGVGLYF